LLGLKNCVVKVQTTLVASPRNQRYLRPRSSTRTGVFVAEVDESRKLAKHLNPELAFFRHKSDLLNQFADARRSLRARAFVVQGFAQIDDFLPVYFGDAGVQSRGWRGCCFQLTKEVAPPGFEGGHFAFYDVARNAGFDSLD
jgi:hypothetical protein